MIVSLNVKPNSKQDTILDFDQDYLSISVMAEAREGEANEAVVEFVAEIFNVKKNIVELIKGHKSH